MFLLYVESKFTFLDHSVRTDLENSTLDLQNGNIEGAAAQIVHGNQLSLLLIHAIRQGCGGGLVDHTLHVQTGDLARIFGSLKKSSELDLLFALVKYKSDSLGAEGR